MGSGSNVNQRHQALHRQDCIYPDIQLRVWQRATHSALQPIRSGQLRVGHQSAPDIRPGLRRGTHDASGRSLQRDQPHGVRRNRDNVWQLKLRHGELAGELLARRAVDGKMRVLTSELQRATPAVSLTWTTRVLAGAGTHSLNRWLPAGRRCIAYLQG